MKKFAIIGMVISIAFIIVGVLVISGELGGNTNWSATPSYQYDFGAASFGGDFYTYVNNNAYFAGRNAAKTADNLMQLGKLFKNVFGIGFIGMGALSFCYFGIMACKKTESKAVEIATVKEPQSVYCSNGTGWHYICGRQNADYISTCVCGMSQREAKTAANSIQ